MKLINHLKKLVNTTSIKLNFEDLKKKQKIYLYAGDVPQNGFYNKFIGLSLSQSNFQHIKHDITKPLPIEDSTVDIFQSEDVFEHIEPEKLTCVINEIYRVLKQGGTFRLSLPDYCCDILDNRTIKNKTGKLIFDPGGGGDFVNGKIINGGHVWFPLYKTVKELLEKTHFDKFQFYHYYDELGNAITNPIDYNVGHIMRTPDHDDRVKDPYRPMSIVVDCIK